MKNKKLIKTVSAFALVFGIFVLGGRAPGVSAEKMDKIVAIVNGDVITEDELAVFSHMAAVEPDDLPASPNPEESRRFFLQRLIEDKLMLQEALRLKLKADERQVEERVKEIRAKAGRSEVFEQALHDQGLTLNDLRQKLRQQLLIYLIMQYQVKSKVIVSPKEITEYYQAHPEEFAIGETVVLDSIFVEDKETLAALQADLASGAAFGELAEKYSKKSSLGFVRRGQLKKELEDFIFSLEPGSPSAPYEVEGGFYIFLPKERLNASASPLADVKDEIKKKLEREKADRILREWLVSLKDKAYISIRGLS